MTVLLKQSLFYDLPIPRSASKPFNFFFLTLGMLVTQRRPRWFNTSRHRSGGALLVLLWTLAALVVDLCFNTTLLAYLVAVDLTPPVDTFAQLLGQVQQRGGNVWNVQVTKQLFR